MKQFANGLRCNRTPEPVSGGRLTWASTVGSRGGLGSGPQPDDAPLGGTDAPTRDGLASMREAPGLTSPSHPTTLGEVRPHAFLHGDMDFFTVVGCGHFQKGYVPVVLHSAKGN